MPAIDTDELSSQFVSLYRDNVFCNQQKVYMHVHIHVHVVCKFYMYTVHNVLTLPSIQMVIKYGKIMLEAKVLQMTGNADYSCTAQHLRA